MSQQLKATCQKLLDGSGVVIDGPNPWDPQIHDDRFYQRVIAEGSLGLGESYMDGWWDCDQLDVFFDKILRIDIRSRLKSNWRIVYEAGLARFSNLQSKKRAFQVGEAHYDIGNDLYELMLDPTMTYTCGYWKDAETLADAQEAKLDLVCKKIGLKEGDRVLDIGSGWGSMLIHAAKNYGVTGVGLTISREQASMAKKKAGDLPIEFRLQDYREINEPFDHVISLGMVEHVGYKNYREYMKVAERCLKPGGFFLLHTIGSPVSVKTTDVWINKYIFPNGMLPSVAQLAKAAEDLFIVEDWHSFGADYDKTLMAWQVNADKAWEKLDSARYDKRFRRMWDYYLLSLAGAFRTRHSNQLWQIVLSKGGVPGGYKSVR